MILIEKVMKNDLGAIVAKAAVRMEETDQVKTIIVILQGAFFLEHAEELKTFLLSFSESPGLRCKLQLHGLKLISQRGVLALAAFVRSIEQRGGKVEISGIKPAVRVALKSSRQFRHF